jgi:hypothetical protein
MSKGYYLSKSKMLSGWQCHKKLWLEIHDPDKGEVDESMERIFAMGHEVGAIAQSLFPDGVLIKHDRDLSRALEETEQLLSEPGPLTLFEATLRHEGVLIRADVLLRDEDDEIRLIEVKAGTKVKPVNYIDCTVQTWVLAGLGLTPARVDLAHINNQFIYPGGGDYQGLITFENITRKVMPSLANVPRWLEDYRAMLKEVVPAIRIGPQCRNPYECQFLNYCTPPQSAYPVRKLPNGGKVVWELIEDGIDDIREIPAGRLTNKTQEWVRQVTKAGTADLKPDAAEALAELPWPRYYFDFETVSFAIPVWEGTRPYQALPFQWSCHVDKGEGQLEHREFLADGREAPMRDCAKSLIAALGDSGPILVYTSYEAGVLRTLINLYPDLLPELEAIISRLVDLYPITKANYYHPDMLGSWSIKAVLPTVAPEMNYADLGEIQEGMGASEAFLEIMDEGTSEERRQVLHSGLVEYCAYDTLAMVKLANTLSGSDPR